MQPPFRRPRRIGQSLRREPQLVYERLSDPILVRRARDGDRRALETLCARHAPRVQAIARHLLGDGEDARDAAQDALARLCAKLGQFRGEAAFATWLHRLSVNACKDVAARRASRRWEPLEDDLRPCPATGPVAAAELSELRAELRAGLSELPATQARVVVLKDALDWSFVDIAQASGMPVGTAKCYAHRGRAGLRALLERAGAPA